MESSKIWWKSKQIWVSLIALIATAVQAQYGFVVSPELQGYALGAVMVILRLVTKGPVTLSQ